MDVGNLHKAWWGPRLWRLLHLMAEKWHPANDADWTSFLALTQRIMPCIHCREHFASSILAKTSVMTVRSFLFQIHNDVNTRTGKILLEESDLSMYRIHLAKDLYVEGKRLIKELHDTWVRAEHIQRIPAGITLRWERLAFSILVRSNV